MPEATSTGGQRDAKGGRPEIGGAVHVRLGESGLADIDAFAASQGVTRAGALRRLISLGLASERPEQWAVVTPHGIVWADRRPLVSSRAPGGRRASDDEARELDAQIARREWQRAPGAEWETDGDGRSWAPVERAPGHWETYRLDEFALAERLRYLAVSYAPHGQGDVRSWRGLPVKVVNTLGGSTARVALACAAPDGFRWPAEIDVPFWALSPLGA